MIDYVSGVIPVEWDVKRGSRLRNVKIKMKK